jgi:hypothetical protein
LLFQPDVSGLLGTAGAGSYPPIINAGNVLNQGVELEGSYSKRFRNGFYTSVALNGTWLTNVVQKVPEGVDFIPGAAFGVGGNVATRFEEGFPIGYFVGYRTDGVWQTQEEIDNSPIKQAGAKPGDLKYADINGDGVINFSDDSDKEMIGSPIPDFTFGFNFNVSYKGIDLSANMFAAIGQEIIRNYERQQPYANMLTYNIERWTGPNSTNTNPRLTTELTRNTVFSDFYVEDGSYLRLRNVQVGYTLNPLTAKKIGLAGLRVYIAANNLLTITNYQGFDPDIGSFGGALGAGVDYGFYPQARNVMLGFSIKL